MTKQETELVLNIVDLAITHGVPAISKIIDTWSEDKIITVGMIEEVINSLKDPDKLFED